jgi:hypothetical protein
MGLTAVLLNSLSSVSNIGVIGVAIALVDW